jgi:hypothetical protein
MRRTAGRPGRFRVNPSIPWGAIRCNGYASPSAAVSLVDGVWEICSTGGAPETFTVSKYQLTSS